MMQTDKTNQDNQIAFSPFVENQGAVNNIQLFHTYITLLPYMYLV